jgi:hypothetical protein
LHEKQVVVGFLGKANAFLGENRLCREIIKAFRVDQNAVVVPQYY